MATKTAMSMQEIKDKIDGYHCLQADGHLSAGDCGDAIGDLTRHLNAKDYDEAHDYAWESYRKHGLNK
jgi:hypothetical protein